MSQSPSPSPTASLPIHPVKGVIYAALVALQIASILVMVAWKGSVLIGDGPTVVIRTLPVDPRSLFMGDYVRLKFEMSETAGLPYDASREPEAPVWVVLGEGPGGIWSPVRVTGVRPSPMDPAHPYVAGTVEWCSTLDGSCLLHFGIEEYYVPEDHGLALEEAARNGTVLATVKLDGAGHAAILELHWPGDGTLPPSPPPPPTF